jgi:hypothetical protein
VGRLGPPTAALRPASCQPRSASSCLRLAGWRGDAEEKEARGGGGVAAAAHGVQAAARWRRGGGTCRRETNTEETEENGSGRTNLNPFVAPESMARQGRSRGPPRQLGSNPVATMAHSIAPLHVARQYGYAAPRSRARLKGLLHKNIFFLCGYY